MWMPNYRRNFVPGGTFFFTVALLVSEIDLLRKSVRRVKGLYPFEINAWVVLPDHLHCIWTLPEGDRDFATRKKFGVRSCLLLLPVNIARVGRIRAAIRHDSGSCVAWFHR
jgi:REP element-mobilizing transposase RayT